VDQINSLTEREIEETNRVFSSPDISAARFWVGRRYFNHAVEEVGEMAKCLRGRNDVTMMEEAVDATICTLAIALLEADGDREAVIDMLELKLDKWKNNMETKV
jgi:hypothetical protein